MTNKKRKRQGKNDSSNKIQKPASNGKPSSFLEKMRARLSGGHFRMINEKLYTCTGKEALDYFREDSSLFNLYHAGYKTQMSNWPEQPVNVIIKWLKKQSPSFVVADFGCGEALIAKSVKNTVFSLDLVSNDPDVIACDMANTPLGSASADVAVFCLSLMGTNYQTYLEEACRVLKPGGWLLIAEVKSRFDPNTGGADPEKFSNAISELGFNSVKRASPCIRFNKEGIPLAVSTSDNGVKILANAEGIRLLRTVENRAFDASRAASAANVKPPTIGAFPSTNVAVGTSLADRTPPVAAMVGLNNDSRSLADVKPRIVDEAVEKSRIWKLTEINEQSQCRSLKLPDGLSSMRVSRLIYTNQGVAILALAANAVHKLWKWQKNDRNTSGKATASLQPQLWQPSSGILMTNEIGDTNPEDAVSCFALSKNDSYVMSASGGKISLFNMMTFKTMTTFMPPPPAATFLAFHPQDNNIIAIGMDDSSIQIYNVRVDEVKTKLKGHQKRITGLAFSHVLNILVSSGADSQLCVWSTDGWEKQTNKFLQMPNGRAPAPLADTRVQFHLDQTHLLAVHETQIAIYEAPKLECLKQWVPREASGPITHATYSCDSQSIYVSFEDGSVGVLTASTLRLRCRINQTAYLNPNPSLRVFPLVIAAHPSESNQFALGLTDGGVHVLEPLESEGRWGSPPPTENGVGPSTPSGASVSEQPQR